MRILADLGLAPWGSAESLLPPSGAGSVLGTGWGQGDAREVWLTLPAALPGTAAPR